MFAFIVSLFPLTVITKLEHGVLYVLVDGALFAVVCLIVEQIGYYFTKTKSSCVIDSLLLCNKMKAEREAYMDIWNCTVCVGSMHCVRIAMLRIAMDPKKDARMMLLFRWHNGRKQFIKEKAHVHNVVMILCGVTAICVVAGIVFFMPEDTTGGYVKVAEFLTGDEVLGPMLYKNQVYIPVNEQMNLGRDRRSPGISCREKRKLQQSAFASLRLQIYCILMPQTRRIVCRWKEQKVVFAAPVTEREPEGCVEKRRCMLALG